MERKSKRKLHEECWDLDTTFLKWLNIHLKVYLKDASEHIDLDFYKFSYKGKEYTQKQIIEHMIDLLDSNKDKDWWDDDYKEFVDEVLDLWKIIFPAMWW